VLADALEVGVNIDSDVQTYTPHPAPEVFERDRVFSFPLRRPPPSEEQQGQQQQQGFLCSQEACGQFTHFLGPTCHAVDFGCEPGTDVVAVADGTVVQVLQGNRATGIHVHNLFHWNSVTLALDGGLFVEYVHIQQHSACVAVGDTVKAGDVLCKSGAVGFCPTPHLHIQMHDSKDPKAPTIKFAFRSSPPSSSSASSSSSSSSSSSTAPDATIPIAPAEEHGFYFPKAGQFYS
jgi:murein DD-endopeptidase MepM/ murein hydrolase activator NlpD